ncbi:hypothetical protein CLOM_g12503 [Closterium sp. NIES-68]|nr:hypothetical protein CLOM_g12503 [Closterium sp. NIES-68]GJP64844.1 hypothetical protein CLOP_g21786 [Closterium sp. NIES-67]
MAAMLSSARPLSAPAVSSQCTAAVQPSPPTRHARPVLFHLHRSVAVGPTPLRAVPSALPSAPLGPPAPAHARVTAAASAAGSPSGPAGLPFRKKSGGGSNSGGRAPGGPAPPQSASQAPSASALGYHPLEHVPAEEQDGRGRAGTGKDGRRCGGAQLSPAEVARTVAEVNVQAIVFAALTEGSAGVLAADARFVVDHNGDVFVEVDEDDDFLRILHEDARLCSALVGFGSMEEVALDDLIEGAAGDHHGDSDDDDDDDETRGFRGSDVRGQGSDTWQSLNVLLGGAGDGGGARGEHGEEEEEEDEDEEDSEEEDEEDVVLSEDDRHFWRAVIGPDADHLFDTLSPEALGSLGAWGGRETLQWVHPVYFADKMIAAVGADPMADMTRPVQRLLLLGRVRPLSSSEEFRVRGLLGERLAEYEYGEGEGESGAGGVEASEAGLVQGGEGDFRGRRSTTAAAGVGEAARAADDVALCAGEGGSGDEVQEEEEGATGEEHGAGADARASSSGSAGRREGDVRVRKPEAPKVRGEQRAAPAGGASESGRDAGSAAVDATGARREGAGGGGAGREEETVAGVVGYRVEGLERAFLQDSAFPARHGGGKGHADAAHEVSWGAEWRVGEGDSSECGSSSSRDGGGGGTQSDAKGAGGDMAERHEGEDGNGSAQGASSSSADGASALGSAGSGILELPPGATWLSAVGPGKDAQSGGAGGEWWQAEPHDLLGPAARAAGGMAGERGGEDAEGEDEANGQGEGREGKVQGAGGVGLFSAAEGAHKANEEQEDQEEDEEEEGSEGEEGWEGGVGTVLYKLDLVHIHLLASSGCQEEVAPQRWQEAAPDLLAHVADSIVQRANALQRAQRCMRELCAREHGIHAEEVWLVGIDHLGIDVRVRMGLELKTLRFPFRYPAATEVAAERLLDELLRPRPLPSPTAMRLNPRLSARQLRRLRARMRR